MGTVKPAVGPFLRVLASLDRSAVWARRLRAVSIACVFDAPGKEHVLGLHDVTFGTYPQGNLSPVCVNSRSIALTSVTPA